MSKLQKIIDLKQIPDYLVNHFDKKIGLCHGVFDLLHIGHIKYLQEAKSKCDILIVTLTQDKFVNKGPGRPAFNENQRADAIAALNAGEFNNPFGGPGAITAADDAATGAVQISYTDPTVTIKTCLTDACTGDDVLTSTAVHD